MKARSPKKKMVCLVTTSNVGVMGPVSLLLLLFSIESVSSAGMEICCVCWGRDGNVEHISCVHALSFICGCHWHNAGSRWLTVDPFLLSDIIKDKARLVHMAQSLWDLL